MLCMYICVCMCVVFVCVCALTNWYEFKPVLALKQTTWTLVQLLALPCRAMCSSISTLYSKPLCILPFFTSAIPEHRRNIFKIFSCTNLLILMLPAKYCPLYCSVLANEVIFELEMMLALLNVLQCVKNRQIG